MVSWCAITSSSVMFSSKSRTSKNSRSIRPISRLPNTPVQIAQCTFFSDESFKYYEKGEEVESGSISKFGCKDAYFAGYDDSAKENALIGPLFEGNV